jgi:hypothetical protein
MGLPMRVLLIVGLWALLLAAGVVVGIVLPRRRSRIFERKASALGFTYNSVAKPFLGTSVDTLTVLEDGPSTEVENVLERVDGKLPMLIFDEYLASDVAAVATTFAAFRATSGQLPVFQIGERNILERMEEALGKKTLKIDCDSEFAAHFFVQCQDEHATRQFLHAGKLPTLCEHARHFHIESSPDWLLIYHPGVTVKIDGVPRFVSETTVVAQALLSSNPMPAAA